MTSNEGLPQEQLDRIDEVDSGIHELLMGLAGEDLDFDMEHIGDIRDTVQEVICDRLKLMSKYDFYPWIKECGGCNHYDKIDCSGGLCRVTGGSDDAQCTGVTDCDVCDKWQDADEAPVTDNGEPKRYVFNVTLGGYGKNADEAWQDVIEGFTQEPGPTPDKSEYKIVKE